MSQTCLASVFSSTTVSWASNPLHIEIALPQPLFLPCYFVLLISLLKMERPCVNPPWKRSGLLVPVWTKYEVPCRAARQRHHPTPV